jgi:hypothetical protein
LGTFSGHQTGSEFRRNLKISTYGLMLCRNNERFNGVIQIEGITEFLTDKKIEKVAEGNSENGY